MANKNLFTAFRGMLLPATNTLNSEQAPAYALSPKQALAQYAATGCLNRTFYASAEEQLQTVLQLCEAVSPEFVAQIAIQARTEAQMKDMPALLCAWLSVRDARLHAVVFHRVIDSTRMLRTYVQILRSGAVGRKSLGSGPKRLVQQWLEGRDEASLFRGSVGKDPSLPDILKMVHPKPASQTRSAFYGYLIGRPHDANALPELVSEFESFKGGKSADAPDLPFTMLAALPLSATHWAEIARTASWQTVRMNLNTFARHGVFTEPGLTTFVADRLRSEEEIRKSRVLPYQLLVAYQSCDDAVPGEVKEALQDAMELATTNVPVVAGQVVVCPDVSGSMRSPVTGHRTGGTTKVHCVDVAALVAAALMRKNRGTTVLPFEQDVIRVELNARDSVMTNATRLASIGGGGTNCSAALRHLNRTRAVADLVIYVSDNESWLDQRNARGTAMLSEWTVFRLRNPRARLVCLDLQPNTTTQAPERPDILNIGGFSDQVFGIISAFAKGDLEADHWVSRIEAVAV